MSDEEEFGQQGVEQRTFGSQPIYPDTPPEDVSLSVQEAVDAVSEARPEERPTIERDYIKREDGQPKRARNQDGTFASDADGNALFEREPSRNWVTPEEAGRDLAAARDAEAQALHEAERAEIARAVDEIRSGQPQQPEYQHQPQPEQWGQQPPTNDYLRQQLAEGVSMLDNAIAGETDLNTIAGLQAKRAELAKSLEEATYRAAFEQYPELTHSIENEINTRTLQYQAQVAQAFQQSQAATQTALASLTTNFPELAGVNTPQDLQTALTVMERSNPERWQAAVHSLRSVAATAQNAQQIGQQHAANQAAQLQAYKQNEIKIFEQRNPQYKDPETAARASRQVISYLKDRGLSDADFRVIYENPIVHHHVFQEALADAIAYRESRNGIREKIARPPAKVQRPSGGSDIDLRSQYEGTPRMPDSMSAKEAAQFLIARRSRR